MANYKPLPFGLTIKSSSIQGLGVFTTITIKQGTNLGMSHLQFGSEIIRTPLGGFINHSEKPNCEKVKLRFTNMDNHKLTFDFNKWNLVTIQDIKAGEELTVKYDWYKV
jgi:hypothetical protein